MILLKQLLHHLFGLIASGQLLAMSLWTRPNGPQSIAASSSSQAGLSVQTGLNPLFPVTFLVTGTSEVVVTHPQNNSIAFTLPLSPNQGLEQVPFDLVLSGYIKTTNSGTVTLKIYSGTSLTPGSDTQVATSGAITQNTATAPFEMSIRMVYDSVSGKLTGSFRGLINNTLIATAAISNVITGISDTTSPVANFVVSVTSSAASGSNPLTLNIRNFTAG